ncbi:hypothetical protein V2J09_013971 [Rumex salicifolius]
MQNLDDQNVLVSVWATFLVVVYVGYVDAATVNDPVSSGLALMKFFIYVVYVTVLISRDPRNASTKHLNSGLGYLLAMSEIRILYSCAIVSSAINDSNRIGLFSFLWRIRKYNINLSGDRTSPDETAVGTQTCGQPQLHQIQGWQGFKWRKRDHHNGQNLELQRWVYLGKQGRAVRSAQEHHYKIHKFAGLPLYESSDQKEVWKSIQQDSDNRSSLFYVVEVELSFLYDFFCGRGFALFVTGFWLQLIEQLIFHGLVGSTVHPQEQELRIQYHKYDVDVLAKGMVIITITLTQIEQNVWDRCIKKAAEIHCLQRPSEPRQTKLSQYSLLYGCSTIAYVPLVYSACLRLFGITYSIILSEEIKKAVIRPLIEDSESRLSNGSRALESIQIQALGDETKRKLVKYC